MTSSVTSKWLPLILAVLALASLAGAVTLQALGLDASEAWTAFIGFSGTLVGTHLPAPGQLVTSPAVAVAPVTAAPVVVAQPVVQAPPAAG